MTVNHGVPGSSPGEGADMKAPCGAFFFLVAMESAVVYILYSEKLDKFYVGKSENFRQRLIIHNSDENEKWSKAGRPWAEYLVIKCVNFKQAGKIERYIKAQKSRKYIVQLKEKPSVVENLMRRFCT
jgi:putative endonuclease